VIQDGLKYDAEDNFEDEKFFAVVLPCIRSFRALSFTPYNQFI